MAKVWINPSFKEKLEVKVQEKQKNKKNTNKISPSDEYVNKKIKDNKIVQIKFIDDEIKNVTIEWADQRYIKIRNIDNKEGFLAEKRSIKYMK